MHSLTIDVWFKQYLPPWTAANNKIGIAGNLFNKATAGAANRQNGLQGFLAMRGGNPAVVFHLNGLEVFAPWTNFTGARTDYNKWYIAQFVVSKRRPTAAGVK